MDVAQAAASLPERLLAFGVVPQEEPEEPAVSGAAFDLPTPRESFGCFFFLK